MTAKRDDIRDAALMHEAWKFARDFGNPVPRNELFEEIKVRGVVFPGLTDQEIDAMIDLMVSIKMLFPEGKRWVCNRGFKPLAEDWWYGHSDFQGGE